MTHEPHEFDFAAINSIPLGVADDGVAVSVRSGRYGPYLVHGEDRVSIPEATEPDSLSVAKALELLSAPSNDRELGVDDDDRPADLLEGRPLRPLRPGRRDDRSRRRSPRPPRC